MSILLILLLILLQAQPLYSVTFGTGDREVRVATLYMDNTWQVTTLPEGMVLGQRDIALVLPEWNGVEHLYLVGHQNPVPPDGVYTEPDYATALYRYDVQTQSTTHLMDTLPYEEEGFSRYLELTSISPDSRYVWAREYMEFYSYLVDLENSQMVAEFPCLMDAVTWKEDSVFVITNNFGIGASLCSPDVIQLDLSTGNPIQSLTITYKESPDEWLNYMETALWLDDGRLIVQTYDALGIINLETGEQTFLDPGSSYAWSLSHDQSSLVYINADDQVDRVNLITMEVDSLGESLPDPGRTLAWSDNTLVFWTGTNTELKRVEITDDERVETFFYTGDAFDDMFVAPDQSAVVLGFADQGMAVYTAEGQIGDTFSGIEFLWGADWAGQWFHFIMHGEGIAINTVTGETMTAPQPGFWFVGSSPDGTWWLYSRTPASDPTLSFDNSQDSLIAFNPSTGEVVTLAEDVALAERNRSFEPSNYYVWSDSQQ